MRIYVACLASYNNGTLHGRWIGLEFLSIDEARAEIAAMLRESPFPNVTVEHPDTGEEVPSAEEWAIHDHEGFPYEVGEYDSLGELYNYVEAANAADADGTREALDALIGDGETPDNAAAIIHDGDYHGQWDSVEDYAEEYVESCGLLDSMPENLRRYFDMEAFARDLKYDLRVVNGANCTVHIFSP